jgi:uncharacterized protein (DUF2062 family)
MPSIRRFSVRAAVRWLQAQLLDGVRDGASPSSVSLGFALGLFIGIVPDFSIGLPLAFWIARRLGWNGGAALTGTLIVNPLTAPAIYSLSAWLGMAILGQSLDMSHIRGFLDYLRQIGVAFLLGNSIIAFTSAVISGLCLQLFLLQRFRVAPQPFVRLTPPAVSALTAAGTSALSTQ